MCASIDLILVYVVLQGVFYKTVSQISKILFLKIFDLILVYVVLQGVFYKTVSQISKILFLKIFMPL
jgi:hypothetical protein